MQIISHRGYWRTPEEKNTWVAFERSFSLGFGTETDFRDCNGLLVISHDPSRIGALPAADVLGLMAQCDPMLPLAINVKADGLQSMLKVALSAMGIANYFLFDMSIPDTIQSLKAGLRCYTRQSDVELHPVLYDRVAGVLIDAFQDDDWITEEVIAAHLCAGKDICVMSPELHHRPHMPLWDRLRRASLIIGEKQLTLCTDLPEEARQFFAI